MSEQISERQSRGVARAAWNVAEFCKAHDISRAFLYKLWKVGCGPRVLKIGRRTLITPEAGAEGTGNY